MLYSLLSGGVDANISRLVSSSRERVCSGEVFGVSSRRVSRRALLRACLASPLVVCAAGGRSHTSRGHQEEGVQRVSSTARGFDSSAGSLTASITGCLSGDELLSLVEQH